MLPAEFAPWNQDIAVGLVMIAVVYSLIENAWHKHRRNKKKRMRDGN